MKANKEITIIGYGNQAQTWARNLNDSGYKVHIGLRTGSRSYQKVLEDEFLPFDFTQKQLPTLHFVLLIPDDQHYDALESLQASNDKLECILAHGHSMQKYQLEQRFPKYGFTLLAPKSIASEMRVQYLNKKLIPAGFDINSSKYITKLELEKLAFDLGIKDLFKTNFLTETEVDLFSEQAVLCSVIPYGIGAAIKTLVDAGYDPKLAFYECFFESKLIMETLYKVGPEKFFELISPNALIGSQIGKETLTDTKFEAGLKDILENIRGGNFEKMLDEINIEELRNDITQYWKSHPMSVEYQKLLEGV